jgi:hypothetical protein
MILLKLSFSLLGILAITSGTQAWAAPAQVIIIRHGEKPDVGNELSTQGQERAQALPSFFENNEIATRFGLPVAVYAMGQKPNDPDDSLRAIETVAPLAQALGLTLNDEYTRQEIQPLVDTIMQTTDYDGKNVVICWEHTMIPEIAAAFGVNNPPQWPGNVFDRAWVIDFSNSDGSVQSFQNIPEDVLPGDSTDVQ